MPALNPRRHLLVVTALGALALSSTAEPASATVPGPGLTGTWEVTRVCSTGCTGTTILTEHVVPYRRGVFRATGDVSQLLYPISTRKVLTHAATSSSLLTTKVPGETMRGLGVAGDGSTFTVVWQCIGSNPAAKRTRDTNRLTLQPLGRAVC